MIYAISDLHLSTTADKPMDIFGSHWENYVERFMDDWRSKVTDDDIVLISGDISWAMELDDALTDLRLLEGLKGKKVFIRGNHDYWWKSISRIRAAAPEGFYFLQNDAVKFGDVVICGSRGWTIEGASDFTAEDRKLYLRETERLRLALKSAEGLRKEGDKLIVMIHYPPFNVRREPSLFTELFVKNSVDKVVYGHLHGKDCKADLYIKSGNIEYYLTSCDQVDDKLTRIL